MPNDEMDIRNFIEDNYSLNYKKGDFIIRNTNGKFIVDCIKYNCVANSSITSLTNSLFEWGKMRYFACTFCDNLTSLEGAPQECDAFHCERCEKLINLEGAPKKCKSFNCTGCDSITSLEGAPKECNEFNCSECLRLKSLEGAPKECNLFDCSKCKNLKSLEGAPKECNLFFCDDCESLCSFKGMPRNIKQTFSYKNCDLLRDEELPYMIKGKIQN